MPKKYLLASHIIVFCLIILIILQIVFAVFIVKQTYIAGPVQDVWGIMPYIQQNLYKDTWLTSDLLTSLNSHRIPLLKLSFLTDYGYFNGSNYFVNALIALAVFIQIIFLFAINKPSTLFSDELIILLCAASILMSPTINWGFLHHFNIHIVQSAMFALIACIVFNKGITENNIALFAFGILAACLCNISAFTITAIWPALLFLVFFNKSSAIQKILTVFLAAFFFISYICITPITLDHRNDLTTTIALILQNLADSFSVWGLLEIAHYLVRYMAIYPADFIFNKIISALSLIWFLYAIFTIKSFRKNKYSMTGLSLMLFSICMGITTAIGRGFLGDLSLGIRFQPISLLYWCGFIITTLSLLSENKNKMSFIVFSWIIFAYLSSTHYLNAIENQKQMLGDYTRFSRMQMAYISNNLGPNAVYENMVEEWRKKSYPGILLSIPFIRDNELGIFNEPIGAFALNNPTLPPTTAELCLAGKFYEKPRNNDKSIRNITFSASRIERPDVTHLLIYERSKLNGALFKRPSEILKVEDDNVWVGLVKTPIDLDHLFVIAFREGGEVCRVSILK